MTPRHMSESSRSIAALLQYPEAGYCDRVMSAAAVLSGKACEQMEALAADLAGWELSQLEEAYIRVFDLNPDCTLDIGWHLFGEDYARGEFLVKLKAEHRKYGTEDPAELPDHLPSVLRLLAEMPESDAPEFIRGFLSPALAKIRANAKEEESPFARLLSVLAVCLEEVQSPAVEAVHE